MAATLSHSGLRAPAERAGGGLARARRVSLLAVAIALMSLADLQLTLTYMRSTGMIELNPLARAMVDLGGARQLILFKVFSILTSAGVLYLVRRHRIAETCAWLSVAAMLALTVHWTRFNAQIAETPDALLSVAASAHADHRWVALTD